MLHTPTKSLLIPALGLLLVTQLLVTPGCSSDEKDCTIIVEADADGAEDTVVFVDSSVTEEASKDCPWVLSSIRAPSNRV